MPLHGDYSTGVAPQGGRRSFLYSRALNIDGFNGHFKGSPIQVSALVKEVAKDWNVDQIGLHLHDTYGMAIANITMAMAEHGVSMVESSVGGLGGCPYAPGATGNVATEDVLYLCHKLGIETGVDLDAIVETAKWVTAKLQAAEDDE